MNLKNNFKLSKTIFLSFMLLISLVSGACGKVFETVCNPDTIRENNGGEPVYLSVMHGENGKLPENFEIKIEFDNEVFKKSAKINYSDEISKNYKHNKSIFGNEISVKCSLKASKSAPDTAENQELLLLTVETKKSIPKSETNFKITAEGDLEKETQNIPIKIERLSGDKSSSEKSSALLTKLIPSQGILSPEFNPSVKEYSVNVPYSTKDIEFDVDSENSSGININRHKLKAAGSQTDIFITVKGRKRGDKNIYHVSVNRDSSPEGQNTKSRRTNPKDIIDKMVLRKKSSKGGKKKSRKYDSDEDETHEDGEENSNLKAFKEMEINRKENEDKNRGNLYSIVILSSILCLSAAYMIIKKKKQIKNKKELNKNSEK